jgi:arginase family enzyme
MVVDIDALRRRIAQNARTPGETTIDPEEAKALLDRLTGRDKHHEA